MKEFKKYGLRPAKTPQQHSLLSGVVYVVEPAGKGYAYIHFDESFVDAVGTMLPEGVSVEQPAFLKAIYMPGHKLWRVFAMYIKKNEGVILWETAERPIWLAKIRRVVDVQYRDQANKIAA